ncbi:MAG: iron-containing alcohol dehydrogenase [Lachnospiraceae bacterium]|nr:iron-containing alcohol dehydrogenase [Lachnospiraceae bacterium]
MWQPQGFYNEYTLRTPVILSGENSVRGLYNYPAAKIAVIHGTSFCDRELFLSTFSKREVRFFARSWKDEPSFEGLRETIGELEDFKPDVIIAVGGGSVIDGSKLCRLLYEFPYFDPKTSRVSGHMMKTRFIAVPTTVGSGAEVSSAAVFYDSMSQRKDMVVIHELQPDVVIYDQKYIIGTPHRLLCASALDATAHILEGYVSIVQNSFTDVLAEEGLSLLHEELKMLISGKDCNYSRLQYAGYIGGIVQNHCIVGAAHAIAHQLTEQGYSHSEAVSLLLPAVIRINMTNGDCYDRYKTISERAGFTSIDEMLYFIESIVEFAGLSNRRDALIEHLTKAQEEQSFCQNAINDRGGNGNPVEITGEYIKQLIRSM